jgi:hypothetical protein
MEEGKQSFEQAHKTVASLFDAAFEACKELPYEDRQLMLKEVAKRILLEVSNTPWEEQKAVSVVGIEVEKS